MPSTQWANEDSLPYQFIATDTKKFRGYRLRGTSMLRTHDDQIEVNLQEWKQSIYEIGFRILRFFKKIKIFVRDPQQGYRIEAVLSGELLMTSGNGQQTRLKAGQYHVTNINQFILSNTDTDHCEYFVSYYSPELLKEFGYENLILTSPPAVMPEAMLNLLHKVLHHPYDAQLGNFYYQNIIRDLFFIHLTATKVTLPGSLSAEDLAAVYRADVILSKDLSDHFSIRDLSLMAGTNAFKLKKGFRQLFNMGVFGRLLHKRMEHAKLLLETTSQPIKEIALDAGYASPSAFVTAFRKRFGKTPLEWREKKPGSTL